LALRAAKLARPYLLRLAHQAAAEMPFIGDGAGLGRSLFPLAYQETAERPNTNDAPGLLRRLVRLA
jgi:hypothetical protein